MAGEVSGECHCLSSMNSETKQEGLKCRILPLETALIRWSVVHIKWNELANDIPCLTAFLAGWCCRSIGASMPEEIGGFRDSFRVGWREADTMINIETEALDREPETKSNLDRP